MHSYRERLLPSFWIYVSTALVIPASLLVFLPINPTVGVVVALALYLGVLTVLIVTSPVISVEPGFITAGRARMPIEFAGPPQSYSGTSATLERGRHLDARAWVVIRGWIDPVVKIPVMDADDPAPYWLVSSRKPGDFSRAVLDAKLDAH